MSPQGADRVPPEVWLVVFQHARLPIPPTLSRPKRSELHQETLTVLARTCKLFNALAIPLLYKTIITDNLLEFSSIKRNLLTLCESLYIEYQDEDPSFGYQNLLEAGGKYSWDHVGPDQAQAEEFEMERCDEEVGNIVFILHQMSRGPLSLVLPRLATVAIGALHGQRGDVWTRYEAYDKWAQEVYYDHIGVNNPVVRPKIAECVKMWDTLIKGSSVSHVCIRDPLGPLGFPRGRGHSRKQTIHFGPDTPGLELHAGQNATWVSDTAQDQAWEPMHCAVLQAIASMAWKRAHAGALTIVGPSPDPMQVDIYGSTNHLGTSLPTRKFPVSFDPTPLREAAIRVPGGDAEELSVDVQRAIAYSIGSARTSHDDNDGDDRDPLRWFPSHDYPGCKSCGSGPPL